MKFRKSMVAELETRLELAKQGTPVEMLNSKFDDRRLNKDKAEQRNDTPTRQELQAYKMIEILENGAKISEDAHPCKYCTDFCYLSMVKCNKCEI